MNTIVRHLLDGDGSFLFLLAQSINRPMTSDDREPSGQAPPLRAETLRFLPDVDEYFLRYVLRYAAIFDNVEGYAVEKS